VSRPARSAALRTRAAGPDEGRWSPGTDFLSGVWRLGLLQDLPGAVNDLLAVGFAWVVLPLDDPLDEWPEDGGVIRVWPDAEPDQPAAVFGGQLPRHYQLTQPADESPSGACSNACGRTARNLATRMPLTAPWMILAIDLA
jgi:hypothetical protein